MGLYIFFLNVYRCVVLFEFLGVVDMFCCILFKCINVSNIYVFIRNFEVYVIEILKFMILFNIGLNR